MINLLPPDVKENIAYARRNTLLSKWATALGVATLCVIAVVGAGHLYLNQSIKTYASQAEAGKQDLKAQKLEETQAQVQELTDSLKLVVQVLQREILFSKLLTQTGAALPSGSVLTSLNINKVQGGLDLQAAATDYQTATQVQVNLQDPKNNIFEKADILNIQCLSAASVAGDPLKSKYPCTIQLRALFAKNNSFSFINSANGTIKP